MANSLISHPIDQVRPPARSQGSLRPWSRLRINVMLLMLLIPIVSSCTRYQQREVILVDGSPILYHDCLGNSCVDVYNNVLVGNCKRSEEKEVEFAGHKIAICRQNIATLHRVDPGPIRNSVKRDEEIMSHGFEAGIAAPTF